MLVNPRLYAQYTRAQDAIITSSTSSRSSAASDDASVVYWSSLPPKVERHVKKMLLIHQSGSVRVGEVVRYTVTYTPARDRVRPVPKNLHVRIRNTCAIALRAAYLHGPYTLYTACYPTTFNPNAKHDSETYGEPQFEPMLKAGGSWTATLKIPDQLRRACEEPSSSGEAPGSCSWIIECTSQVLFSTGATVHYEVIVGRDEKSVEAGFAGLTGSINSVPGRLVDHQQQHRKPGQQTAHNKGVFSSAITVVVEDTACLWNKPTLPGLEHFGFHEFQPGKGVKTDNPTATNAGTEGASSTADEAKPQKEQPKKKRKVHLVVITHGLHSNLGADMLYMKESIDAAAKQARIDARARRKAELTRIHSNPIHDYTSSSPPPPEDKKAKGPATSTAPSTAPLSGGQDDIEGEPLEDEEEVLVRGFSGNAIRTERGIQYLGKRLAKYVLGMTYPDQPFLPVKKSFKQTLSRTFTSKDKNEQEHGQEAHHHSSVRHGGPELPHVDRPYEITSISFIGHSLGGLTQMYAIAYIQKHSPEFFQNIQPVNFIALASPFLGLSNENPLYVKFALDFGLVGRTGQDLGLTWRAPTLARSGWAGVIAGIGSDRQRAPKRVDPGTKPLLRLLPSGPAHTALKLFRNRTVYSNVVNDGIVPLRTSCLLFLDWRGLGRVEKARRENGLIGTMAGWGWAELTGTNQTEHKNQWPWQNKDSSVPPPNEDDEDESDEAPLGGDGDQVPQPADDETRADNAATRQNMKGSKDPERESLRGSSPTRAPRKPQNVEDEAKSPLAGFMSLFSGGAKKDKQPEPKSKPNKIIRRAQTVKMGSDDDPSSATPSPEPNSREGSRDGNTVGDVSHAFSPPKTSVFEAAGDLINPPLPATEFILNPQRRPRTIFHDRIYHPEDIPPPPVKKKPSFMRKLSSQNGSRSRKNSKETHLSPPGQSPGSHHKSDAEQIMDVGSLQVEEKIARAYHRDLSWRKVLVRLNPDAHNNIVVRRMFANAYGWPVIKHLVDTHFADTEAALTADRKEDNVERARPMTEPATEEGDEVKEQRKRATGVEDDEREQMYREAHDELQELKDTNQAVGSLSSSTSVPKSLQRQDSVASSAWTDRFFEGTDDDDSDDNDQTLEGYADQQKKQDQDEAGIATPRGTSKEDVDDFLFGKGVGEGISKGKARESEPRPGSSGLILPVENVTQSPPALTPKTGLGKSIEEKLNIDGKRDDDRK